MRSPPFLLLTVSLLSLLGGCQGCLGCSTSPLDAQGSQLPRSCQAEQPLIEPQKLDILFVVDNSDSMADKQEKVAAQLTSFIDQIKQSGGVRQDFRVGVITTSVYLHGGTGPTTLWREYPEAGLLRPVPDALADGGLKLDTHNERYLAGEDPALVEKFARLVRQGVAGSGQETPFEALRLALLGAPAHLDLAAGGNQGFLRDGARLLVVITTDEDDCSEMVRPSVVSISNNPLVADCTDHEASLGTVSEYHRLFSEELVDSQGHRRDILWTAIAPVGETTKAAQGVIETGHMRNIDCPTSNQPGYRHRQMAEMFDPSLTNLDSICDASFHDTLIRIAELAAVSQVLEVKNIPDPRIVQVSITRHDGTQQLCTQTNAGLEVLEAGGASGEPARLRFKGDCLRRADDAAVEIKLLCAT